MTTLAQLADRAQLTLNDSAAGTWPQATVEAWVLDAIRDYSQTFPMTSTCTLVVGSVDPDHHFHLPIDIIAITHVEYPGLQDPPVFVKRRARTHSQFYGYEGYYDIQYFDDAQTPPIIYLSQEPTIGQRINLTYKVAHLSTLDPGDSITVPEQHESILILYVLWQAFKERLSTEEQDPDTTLAGAVTLLQQLVKGATQAEAEYRRALQRAKANVAEGGITGPWKADIYDPIY
jgi:hypothetical protein